MWTVSCVASCCRRHWRHPARWEDWGRAGRCRRSGGCGCPVSWAAGRRRRGWRSDADWAAAVAAAPRSAATRWRIRAARAPASADGSRCRSQAPDCAQGPPPKAVPPSHAVTEASTKLKTFCSLCTLIKTGCNLKALVNILLFWTWEADYIEGDYFLKKCNFFYHNGLKNEV